MKNELIIAYSGTVISVSGRFIFMYLLYTKKSTNAYSLLFTIMNIISSTLWITYSKMITDTPLMIRSSTDLFLFIISAVYIISNRIEKQRYLDKMDKIDNNSMIILIDTI
jgi:lipid-A-disaccharide synthase-like uncharacterized protein